MAGKQRRAKRSRRRRKTGSKPQSEQPQKKGKGRLRKGLGAVLGFGRKAGGKGTDTRTVGFTAEISSRSVDTCSASPKVFPQ